MRLFSPGSVITRREVLHGRVWLEHPVTVVADDGDVLALRLDPGSSFHFPAHPFGAHPWSAQRAWRGSIVLQLCRRETGYAAWKFFEPDGQFRNWYLNFEPPAVRREDAIEVDDYGLDLVLHPDGRREWKDVEDLHKQLSEGRITAQIVLEVLRSAADVVTALDSDARWWSEWDSWAPIRR